MPHTTSNVPLASVSVFEFCRATGIKKTHFYQQVKAGRIKILKSGSRTLIPVTEIEAFLERLAERDQH